MLVEDDPATRQMFALALRRAGLPVEAAADGEEAIEHLSRDRPGLLLLDLVLPGIDGAVVGAAARAAYGPEFPIIVVTGHGRAAEKGRAMGARAAFEKPLGLDELVAAVRAAL